MIVQCACFDQVEPERRQTFCIKRKWAAVGCSCRSAAPCVGAIFGILLTSLLLDPGLLDIILTLLSTIIGVAKMARKPLICVNKKIHWNHVSKRFCMRTGQHIILRAHLWKGAINLGLQLVAGRKLTFGRLELKMVGWGESKTFPSRDQGNRKFPANRTASMFCNWFGLVLF